MNKSKPILILFLGIVILFSVAMCTGQASPVNFTSYTEVDSTGKITVNSSRITWDRFDRSESGYVYKDYGVNYFDAWENEFTLRLSEVQDTAYTYRFVVSFMNTYGNLWPDPGSEEQVSLIFREMGADQFDVYIVEHNGLGSSSTSLGTGILSVNTTYFLTFERDDTNYTVSVYNDTGRTNQVTSATKTIAYDNDYQYYGFRGLNGTGSNTGYSSGYIENVDIALVQYVNFTTYTEVDPTSKITVNSSRITWDRFDRSDSGYVYKDYGVDSFDSWKNEFTLRLSEVQNTAYTYRFVVSFMNTPGNLWPNPKSKEQVSLIFREMGADQFDVLIVEHSGLGTSSSSSGTSVLSVDTTYYLTFERDETSYTVVVYSDADRTTQITSATKTIAYDNDYRYYGFRGLDGTGSNTGYSSGYIENAKLLY